MPWSQHPRAIFRGLRQSGASLSSLLGFGSSGSGSDFSDHGGEDNARSSSRRGSASPAATGADTPKRRSKRITQVPAGEGGNEEGGVGDGRALGIDSNRGRNVGDRISETGSARKPRGDGFGGKEATVKPLAVLTLGEISFEVSRASRFHDDLTALAWVPVSLFWFRKTSIEGVVPSYLMDRSDLYR